MVKICPNCGKENKDAAKFCENCGQKFEEIISNDKPINSNYNENTSEDINNNSSTANTVTNRPTQFCKYCGEKIDARAEICPKCGVRLKNPVSAKNPAIALILSFLIPGIGQLYNGHTHKCVILIIAAVISFFLIAIYIGFLFYFLVWIYGMYDAYKSAKALNNGELLEDKLFS